MTVLMLLGWSWGHTWASLNTIQAHAYVLTCMHGVLSLLFYIILCKKTHLLEKIGTLIVAVGCLIMILDPKAQRKGEKVNQAASFLSLIANFPGVGFWYGNELLMEMMDTPSVLLAEMFVVNIYLIILSVIFEEGVGFTGLNNNSLVGFLQPSQLYITFFWYAIFSGFLANMGYVICMKFFSPFVVMNCLLLEPIVSQIFGIILEIDNAPGVMTWVAVVLISVAINIIH